MPKIVIVEKSGELREINLKNYTEEELYKKAGFKSSDGFEFQTKWEVHLNEKCTKTVCLYAKTKGRAGQENKYDFPPPVDSKLFFNSCVLLHMENGIPGDLTVQEWEKMYEILFGGFEDIGSEDSSESDVEDEDKYKKTKEGYSKDGFVVDSSNEEEDDDDEMNSSDSSCYFEKTKKNQKQKQKQKIEPTLASSHISPAPPVVSKPTPTLPKKKKTLFEKIGEESNASSVVSVLPSQESSSILPCNQELEEEEYL